MPSFRVTMTIGSLRGSTPPDRVLPTAAAAAARLTTVEASSLNVVAGSARITIRFTAEAAGEALIVGRQVVCATGAVAEVISSVVTERVKGRWYTRR